MAASMNNVFLRIFCIFFSFALCLSLYEDQAGLFDWRQQHIGQAKFLQFDTSGQGGRRLFIATHQNVIASIHSKNGKMGWRHVLEEGDAGNIDKFIHKGDKIVSVTGRGALVRSWNPSVGNLEWETSTDLGNLTGVDAAFFGSNNEIVVVLLGTKLKSYKLNSGKEIWNIDLPNSETTKYQLLESSGEEVVVIGTAKHSHVSIIIYSQDGTVKTQRTIPAGWFDDESECSLVGQDYLVCINPAMGGVQVLHILQDDMFKLSLTMEFNAHAYSLSFAEGFGKSQSDTLFALRFSETRILLFRIEKSALKLVQNLDGVAAACITQYQEKDVLLTLSAPVGQSLQMKALDLDAGTEVSEFTKELLFQTHHGFPVQVTAMLYKKRDGSTAYRVTVVGEDHSLGMYQQGAKAWWSREEGLASITAAEIIDLPLSDTMVELEEEFDSTQTNGENILNNFVKRIGSQLIQLQHFVINLKDMISRARGEGDPDDIEVLMQDSNYMRRDTFNIHKIIVAATASGKVYGLDSYKGKVVWSKFVRDLQPFNTRGGQVMHMYLQRSGAHFPHTPICTIVGRHKMSDTGIFVSFNPVTGQNVGLTEEGGKAVGYNIVQTTMMQQMTQDHLKPIIIMDHMGGLHVFPEREETFVLSLAKSMFVFTADQEKGIIAGYIMRQDMKARQMWAVDVGADKQTITAVASRNPAEHVHSQGVVLGDRSVMYKYLNPNIVGVATEGVDSQGKGQININLIDAVTGHIVFHCNHKKASGPVLLVLSENWLVYTYWNIKNRRNEMGVLELYEGKKQSNATAFSSFNPPAPPIVMRQSFIFPGHISALGVSITEKGITQKHLLVALQTGGIVELPKAFVDPRRPTIMTQEHREEGLIPYIPELPRPFEAQINYNQTLHRVRAIKTAPAGLESTSLVFVYGLDIFYTKVMPSKMFDVLKEDFDYFFISSVLIGMIVVSIISQKLSARKALQRAWK